MDITSTLHSSPKSSRHHRTSSHSRSFSASGLLSILSPTSLVSSISSPGPGSGSGRWRTSSTTLGGASNTTPSSPASAKFGGSISSPNVLGLDVPKSGDEEVDPEEPLPTFEVQPAMLAVDLSLGPGESRSCKFFTRCIQVGGCLTLSSLSHSRFIHYQTSG
jgi:RAB6A-GEF complex partner protein 2